eukprot:1846400-Rhodomonas_salina.1
MAFAATTTTVATLCGAAVIGSLGSSLKTATLKEREGAAESRSPPPSVESDCPLRSRVSLYQTFKQTTGSSLRYSIDRTQAEEAINVLTGRGGAEEGTFRRTSSAPESHGVRVRNRDTFFQKGSERPVPIAGGLRKYDVMDD